MRQFSGFLGTFRKPKGVSGSQLFSSAGSMIYFLVILLAAAWVYQLLALFSLARFWGQGSSHRAAGPAPGVTILKPLKGLEPHTRECLASFLSQDYQPYQVLFGVSDPRDPALPLLRELQQGFPHLEIEVLVCPDNLGPNSKVSTLLQMAPRTKYDFLVIADGDVEVGPDFLSRVVAALQDPGVGLVSCPYRAGAVRTLGAALEALTIAADFIPSVAVAGQVEEIRFALGAAMALSRQALAQSGGLAPLADFLADDYQLGWRVAQTGFRVRILPYPVETHNPEMSFKDYLLHQLRWARTYRVCRPGGYLAYGITHALVFSLALLPAAGLAPWAWGALLATLALRQVLALVSERLGLRGDLPARAFLLLPLKDLLACGLWLSSFLGNKVIWGGQRFQVTREGKLVPR